MFKSKRLLAVIIFLSGILVIHACASPSSSTPESGGGNTEIPESTLANPTDTAQPEENTPEPTLSAPGVLVDIPADISEGEKASMLNEVAFFAPGGGGSSECDFSYSEEKSYFIYGYGNNPFESGLLCFRDVISSSKGDSPIFNLYYPDGTLVTGPQPLFLTEDEFIEFNETPELVARLWLPATMPDGTWRAVLTTDSEKREVKFEIDRPYISVVTQKSGEAVNPFFYQGWDPETPLDADEKLLLHGAHFTPDTIVYLSTLNAETAAVVETIQVRSDANGRFWLWFTVSDAYLDGTGYRMHFAEDSSAEIELFQSILLFQ
jgi:hypothetical protein